MWWKLTRSQFEKKRGLANKKAFKKIIASGEVPGILAYAEKEPVGWCAVEPRENYSSLESSRTLKRIDDQPVWSVVCFFVAKLYRRKGLSWKLLSAAVKYANENGAKIVEGYPVDSKPGKLPDPWVWTGLASSFRKAKFVEVFRRSKTRPIMRYFIRKS